MGGWQMGEGSTVTFHAQYGGQLQKVKALLAEKLSSDKCLFGSFL